MPGFGITQQVSVGPTVEIGELSDPTVKGDLIVGDGTGGPSIESVGTNGQVLTADSTATRGVTWSVNAGGDVTGPGSATDNAVARFDLTTGKIIQNSGVIIDNSNNVTGVVDFTSTGDTVFTPSSNQVLLAASAISVNASIVQVSGSGGAVTLTSVPTIAAGTDGQILIIVGTSDTNTVEIQDEDALAGSNLELTGGNNFIFGARDIMMLVFNSASAKWIEMTRSSN